MFAVTVGFYLDKHIPLPISEGLSCRGVDVLTI